MEHQNYVWIMIYTVPLFLWYDKVMKKRMDRASYEIKKYIDCSERYWKIEAVLSWFVLAWKPYWVMIKMWFWPRDWYFKKTWKEFLEKMWFPRIIPVNCILKKRIWKERMEDVWNAELYISNHVCNRICDDFVFFCTGDSHME